MANKNIRFKHKIYFKVDDLRKIFEAGCTNEILDFEKLIPTPKELLVEDTDRAYDGLTIYIHEIQDEKLRKQITEALHQGNVVSETVEDSVYDQLIEEYADELTQVRQLGETYVTNLLKYGCVNCREWRLKNWGSECNADEVRFKIDDKGRARIEYYSENGIPIRPLLELSKRIDGKLVDVFASDKFHTGTGIIAYNRGQIDGDKEYEDGEMAEMLWEGVWNEEE